MTNNEFWSSVSAIISNGFNNEDLVKLENYAEQFINRQLLFERYTQSEQYGCAEGGSLHVIVTILAGAETPADKLTAPRGSFKRECQRAEAQAAVLESWAKAAGCWVDDIDVAFEKSFGKQLAEGGEAHVYDNGTTISRCSKLFYTISRCHFHIESTFSRRICVLRLRSHSPLCSLTRRKHLRPDNVLSM